MNVEVSLSLSHLTIGQMIAARWWLLVDAGAARPVNNLISNIDGGMANSRKCKKKLFIETNRNELCIFNYVYLYYTLYIQIDLGQRLISFRIVCVVMERAKMIVI